MEEMRRKNFLQHNDVYVVNSGQEGRSDVRHKQIFMEETNMKKIIATVLAMVMAGLQYI